MILFSLVFSVLLLAVMITFFVFQLVLGYLSGIIPNIVCLIIILGIFYTALNSFKNKKLPKGTNISVDREKGKTWINRLVAMFFCILMCGGGYLFYRLAYQNIVNSGASLVEATIIKQETIKEHEITIDEDDPEITSTVSVYCNITFSYELDGENYELTHTFGGVENIKNTKIKIYVKDNNFIATESQTKFAVYIAIGYFILAGLNFLLMLALAQVKVIVFGNIFAAIFGAFLFPLQFSFKQILFSFAGFGSIIIMLTICGLFILLAGLGQGIYDSLHPKSILEEENNTK